MGRRAINHPPRRDRHILRIARSYRFPELFGGYLRLGRSAMKRTRTTRGFSPIPLLASLVVALAGAVMLLAPGGPAAASSSERLTPGRQGERFEGVARKLPGGRITLEGTRQVYLRFRVPESWEGSRIVLVTGAATDSSRGISVGRAGVRWRRGAPVRVSVSRNPVERTGRLTRRAKDRLYVDSLLSAGSPGTLRLTATDGARITLDRTPYLFRSRPSATVSATGDIACSPVETDWNGGVGTGSECRQAAVADLVSGGDDAVLLLGDIQYPVGSLEQFETGFDVSWGTLAARLKPSPGNHEYYTPGASGYYDYFQGLGVETGGDTAGYYSFALGGWTILALNSNCSEVGCDYGDPQEAWFRARLEEAKSAGRCTLAFWHHPAASSGWHGNQAEVGDLWRAFVELGGDVLLSGHDHHYERFGPLDADLEPTSDGPTPWVVGTGGKDLRPASGQLGTRKVIDEAFGLVRFDLWRDSYRWRWSGLGGVGSDSGTGSCRT